MGDDTGFLLLTGFGAFESVAVNPSGALARALHDGAGVVGVELPVSFRRSAEALDRVLERVRPRRPDAILCTGVHPESGFRLEGRARARRGDDRPDVDGETGAAVVAETRQGCDELVTRFDLDALARALRRAGVAELEISDDAGGYVCERIYRHALRRGGDLGAPALFLHVPPITAVPLDEQMDVVRSLVSVLREGR